MRYLSIFPAWCIGRCSGFRRSRDLSLRILDASRCLAGCRLADLLGGHWLMELGGFRGGGGLFGRRRRILARRVFVLGGHCYCRATLALARPGILRQRKLVAVILALLPKR